MLSLFITCHSRLCLSTSSGFIGSYRHNNLVTAGSNILEIEPETETNLKNIFIYIETRKKQEHFKQHTESSLGNRVISGSQQRFWQ
jgi:hypothetical protein